MPVSLTCPSGHRLTVSRRYAGKLVRCPKCGEKTRIPPLETIEGAPKVQPENDFGGSVAKSPQPAASLAPSAATRERKLPSPENVRSSAARGAPVETILPPPIAEETPGELRAEAPPVAAIEAPPVVAPPVDTVAPPPPSPAASEFPAETITAAAPKSAVGEAPAETPIRGYRPDPEHRWTCLSLGVTLALIGVFGAVPAVLEIAEYAQSDGAIPVARWAWVLLLSAAVQIGYAVYAAQLPDWSTAWVVTLVGAALAAGYALLLGLTWFAGQSSNVVAALQLTDQLAQGKAARWCFSMLGILGVYAYFAGRSALRWRHAFLLTRPMKEAQARR